MSTELVAGTPKRIRLLGEQFVAFRGNDGEVAVLDELCPHRGASLVIARTEGCALRCLYHGWKIQRSGAVTEMPAEPEGSVFVEKVRTPSYPVYESAGSSGRISVRRCPPRRFPRLPIRSCPTATV